jgi:hypothetical protein
MLQATLFNEVEPTPGNFSFAGDTQLNHFARAGVPVLGSLAGTPAWAANKSADGGASSVPKTSAVPKPELFRSYVQAVVKHYGASVKAWELWNEPSQGIFFAGSPQEYAALAKIARTEITATDPQALLVVGGFTATEADWQQAAAQAGALAVADVISFHYGADIPLPDAGGVAEYLTTLTALIDRFRSLVSNTTTHPRLWNSEGGTMDSTFLVNMPLEVGLPPAQCLPSASFLHGAHSVVQAEAAMQHLGLEKHFIYLQNGEDLTEKATLFENTNMLDVNNSPRPKLLTRLNFAAQTDGAALPPTLVTFAPGIWAFVFAHTYPERSLLGGVPPTTPTTTVLLWMESTAANHTGTLHAAWPGAVRTIDMMGNPMSVDPIVVSASHVFIHVSTSDVAAVESALRAATCKGCASSPPR